MPWFRVYVETLRDVKLLELPPPQRWVWIAVLAAARQSPIAGYLLVAIRRPMSDKALAVLADVPLRDVRKALEAFEANDMIHRDEDIGAWCVSNWAGRQFESDDVTNRVRKHRKEGTTLERSNNVSGNGIETFSETETDIYLSSSSDSRGTDGISTDCGQVPPETWDAYAEIQFRRSTTPIPSPVPWKRTTATNARTEHSATAEVWWREYELTPRRLAECLIDGQIRNVQKRATT